MAETAEQYKARFASYVEGKDVIAMQRDAAQVLARLTQDTPEERLKLRPAPGKWSVTEIVAHMAEDEVTSTWRYRQMVEHESPELKSFDQDLWAKLGDYASWDTADALQMFRLLREANLRMFEQLTPAQWEREGIHAERLRITVRDLARHTAAHDINHIEQVKRILGAR